MDVPPEASTQSGRFSYQQARAFGLTSGRLARAVKRGELLDHGRGVYGVTSDSIDPLAAHGALVRTAQLSSDSAWYAARRSAALLMNIPLIGKPPAVAQLVRHGGRVGSQGKDRHARVSPLLPTDTWQYDGVDMTTAARTSVDIARAESFRNGVVVADAALRRGVDRGELLAVLAQMKRWPGSAKARKVVAFADGRAESPGESVCRVAWYAEGLPTIEPQVDVYRWGRFVARVDLMAREALLAVESDGAIKFTDAGVLPALITRQEELRDCGIDVMRTNWDETFSDTEAFGRRARQRLKERGRRQLPPGVELRSTSVRLVPPLLSAVAHRAA